MGTEKCEDKLVLPLSQNTAIILVSRNPMFNKCVKVRDEKKIKIQIQ